MTTDTLHVDLMSGSDGTPRLIKRTQPDDPVAVNPDSNATYVYMGAPYTNVYASTPHTASACPFP